MRIACLAVISSTNSPLYISTFELPTDEGLRVQALVHAALDVVEERVALGYRQAPSTTPDSYLGLLSTTEGYRIYGFVSNSKARFLMATKDAVVGRDEDVRLILARLQAAYVDAASNPFHDVDAPITSQKFAAVVAQIAARQPTPPPSVAA